MLETNYHIHPDGYDKTKLIEPRRTASDTTSERILFHSIQVVVNNSAGTKWRRRATASGSVLRNGDWIFVSVQAVSLSRKSGGEAVGPRGATAPGELVLAMIVLIIRDHSVGQCGLHEVL